MKKELPNWLLNHRQQNEAYLEKGCSGARPARDQGGKDNNIKGEG